MSLQSAAARYLQVKHFILEQIAGGTLPAGSRVFVELKEPRDGRRRYTGTLLTVDEGGIALEVDREQVTVAFAEIGKARLAS